MPKFTHDCESCIFLGEDEEHDFYFCPRCDGGSVIARYGSEGSQYSSGPASVVARLEEGVLDADGAHLPGNHPKVQAIPTLRALKLARESGYA